MPADFHGSWDTTTGVNSPLWDGPNDPEPGWSVDGCVKNWVSRGAPQDKLNIGLAFYGRSFKDAQELGVTHGGADYSNWNIDEGTPQYFVSHLHRNRYYMFFLCASSNCFHHSVSWSSSESHGKHQGYDCNMGRTIGNTVCCHNWWQRWSRVLRR